MMITEQDRATARRVIRRHVSRPTGTFEVIHPLTGWRGALSTTDGVRVDGWTLDAAVEAAAIGRAYGKALRGAE